MIKKRACEMYCLFAARTAPVLHSELVSDVVEKITTRRRKGVGVVVEKKRKKSTNFQQKFV